MKKENLNNNPKLSWTFIDGSKRSATILETVAIGKGEYLPGWKWPKHAGAMTGKKSDYHNGYIVSGEMIIKGADGKESKVGAGEAFEVEPGHDAWMVGNDPCVALDFEYLGKKK